jgi:hypothetical protein
VNTGRRNTWAVVCYRQFMAVTFIIIERYGGHKNVVVIDKPDQGVRNSDL